MVNSGDRIVDFFSRSIFAACIGLCPTLSGAAEQLTLAELSTYINSLTTFKSDFRQVNDDGTVSTGTLYVSRPGKMRFEYDPPEQALVVASASAVYIIDRKSNLPPETYPLRRTPLSLILGRNIDLTRAKMVREARFDGRTTVVTAEDPDNAEYGSIQLTFTDAPTMLRQWVIYDAAGGQTTVELSAFETGMDLPNALFSPERASRRDR
ncbi:MAG: outer membrane lipoprotein carrier protein LolA [Roseobacter sp.]